MSSEAIDGNDGAVIKWGKEYQAGDYSYTHDDSVEGLFTKEKLGSVSWHSGWDQANLMRYATVANQLVKIKRESSEQQVRVLDIGCSAANLYTFWNCSYANPGRPRLDYVGLEVRQDPVDKANAHWGPKNLKSVNKCNVYLRDVITDPISDLDGDFDVIVMQEVIEHLPKDAALRCVKDAFNKLRPGGVFIVSTPNPKKHEGQHFVWEDSHVYEYALWEMMNILKDEGFLAVAVQGWLGKAHYAKPRMTEQERAIYDNLSNVSSGYACSVIAYMNPDLAECYTIVAKKASDISKREMPKVESYAKFYEPKPIAERKE